MRFVYTNENKNNSVIFFVIFSITHNMKSVVYPEKSNKDSVRSQLDHIATESPLLRIKEELPELCTLVAISRMMCENHNRDPSNTQDVVSEIKGMLQLLVSIPINDCFPSIEQRKGAESFLIAASTYTSSYADQLDEYTLRLARSCESLRDTMERMEQLKADVLRKYSNTLIEFGEIVKYARQHDAETSDELNTRMETLLTSVADTCDKTRLSSSVEKKKIYTPTPGVPMPIPPAMNSVPFESNANEFQQSHPLLAPVNLSISFSALDQGEEDIDIERPLLSTDQDGFRSFFASNNLPTSRGVTVTSTTHARITETGDSSASDNDEESSDENEKDSDGNTPYSDYESDSSDDGQEDSDDSDYDEDAMLAN